MSTVVDAYVGLGSNLGNRQAHIEAATESLARTEGIEITARSSIIETAPVGPVDQGQFLNAAVALRTTLSPRALLRTCLRIEEDQGRDRESSVRWGPRCVDLDVLLYATMVIDEPGLRIPHPGIAERDFVLTPLAEIAPSAWHPGHGLTIQSLRERLARATPGEYPPLGMC